MVSLSAIRAQFEQRYRRAPRIFSAPGRVNLIGEHTDYNEGFVLPMAIERRTYVAAAPRTDKLIRVYSCEFDETAEFELSADLQPLDGRPSGAWVNYLRGVAAVLERDWYSLAGADLYITSEVPLGAGLSSSAALESSAGFALLSVAEQAGNLLDVALALQKAEYEFAGTQCGIMDQYITCLAQPEHALLIDCRSLGNESVPLPFSQVRVVVCDSRVKHELASGEYNTRRTECAAGVKRLAQHLRDIQSLRDVTVEEFDQVAETLPDVIRRRCNHVINENARVLFAVDALKRGDLKFFGALMYASHESLRDDYEVSCRELDALVEIARRQPGVIGARMTGGGFGGSTVNLVAVGHVEAFVETLAREYEKACGITPHFYVTDAAGGVREDYL
jgi:galactokinase